MDRARVVKGRYQCGCPAELSNAYPQSRVLVPFCVRHGRGLKASTLLSRRLATAVRAAWTGIRSRHRG